MKPRQRCVILAFVIAIIVLLIFVLQQPAPVRGTCKGDAPDLQGIAAYINTANFSLCDLVGSKVILIDMWTYTCINCQRTLPYLTMWDAKYRDKGLVIIGVHSPEFLFEKKLENVQRAVKQWGIKYPVVLDNDHRTWNAYSNRYWPRKYLIDIEGNIVYDHAGEGAYEETEARIQEELRKAMDVLGRKAEIMMPIEAPKEAVAVEFRRIGTPEIYFGYKFFRGDVEYPAGLSPGTPATFRLPDSIRRDKAYLEGEWLVREDGAELVSDAGKVVLKYSAKVVNIVASGPSAIAVLLEGKAPGKARGSAVDSEGLGTVEAEDLYELVNAADYEEHTIEITAAKGFRIYTFTFG